MSTPSWPFYLVEAIVVTLTLSCLLLGKTLTNIYILWWCRSSRAWHVCLQWRDGCLSTHASSTAMCPYSSCCSSFHTQRKLSINTGQSHITRSITEKNNTSSCFTVVSLVNLWCCTFCNCVTLFHPGRRLVSLSMTWPLTST